MKKTVCYLSPLVIVPSIFLTATSLESMGIIKSITPFFLFIALFLFSIVIGVLSPANTKFDYIMTAIVPFSVFFALFITLFFDKGCDGSPQLSLHHALNTEYYKTWLPIVLIMMTTTFVFSFNPIRNVVKTRFYFNKPEK